MNLEQWAHAWGAPYAAIVDLRRQLGMEGGHTLPARAGASEAAVQSAVRLEAARAGVYLWRNNNGVLKNEAGTPVRFGLANDSAGVNRVIKSSDLIGIGPGGQFYAREIKEPGWRYTGTEREAAQLAFINLVISMGGNAAFATGEGTI